ncbi:MAG: hypothetical protein HFJ09_15780 [Lachnospiraceae bacterium]|nr:hypothetical protein [Lachnospiraceae bacterium]
MELQYYENSKYIFVGWSEDKDGEYVINKFGYIPEQGLAEYYVSTDSVDFVLSRNREEIETLHFDKPSVQWNIAKKGSSIKDYGTININNFIDVDEVRENYDSVMIMPYAAPSPPPPPSPKPAKLTVMVTWTVNNVEKLEINGKIISGECLQSNSVEIEVDSDNPYVTLKAYSFCGYYISETKGVS